MAVKMSSQLTSYLLSLLAFLNCAEAQCYGRLCVSWPYDTTLITSYKTTVWTVSLLNSTTADATASATSSAFSNSTSFPVYSVYLIFTVLEYFCNFVSAILYHAHPHKHLLTVSISHQLCFYKLDYDGAAVSTAFYIHLVIRDPDEQRRATIDHQQRVPILPAVHHGVADRERGLRDRAVALERRPRGRALDELWDRHPGANGSCTAFQVDMQANSLSDDLVAKLRLLPALLLFPRASRLSVAYTVSFAVRFAARNEAHLDVFANGRILRSVVSHDVGTEWVSVEIPYTVSDRVVQLEFTLVLGDAPENTIWFDRVGMES
ncbi:hypothetical protein DL766_010084 [Monosporascus sp. MC13-8B]|uniref:MAM domain-containing protein n=1 Tax=Monosporascus cannonballus TaxID=155416 RepID=A0ABY0GZR3_9PEZI|nr:hypothetical protein DL763_009796 [Monosporascus cannonballus]RYO78461.1 hypothetical protein DL762_008687 [Monosporascus cannonballus]RYP10957.1 hypothetical protein DL766_010084 [Monosporascus sp. MC13-8B]